ncbi:MAG: hypothetical protein RLZ64_2042, partial [Pseudomonadota bacterium]
NSSAIMSKPAASDSPIAGNGLATDSAGVDRDLNYLRTNVRDDPKLTSCYFSQRCL